ncbi:TM2 domain-containing protein [Tsukamurella soli]|uniref:TM2 domain-containing protein n=1 Tax=Tsukamurella soli TaxID=644556 RepID=UPI00360E51AE
MKSYRPSYGAGAQAAPTRPPQDPQQPEQPNPSGPQIPRYQQAFTGAQPEQPPFGQQQFGQQQFGQQQFGQQQFTPGQSGAGQFDAGQFGAGQFGAGQFDAGQFDAGQFGAGQFGAGQFPSPTSDKSKVAAGALQLVPGVTLGILGIGRIYAGSKKLGTIQLVLSTLGFIGRILFYVAGNNGPLIVIDGILLVIGLAMLVCAIIDGILMFTGRVRDDQGRPLQ